MKLGQKIVDLAKQFAEAVVPSIDGRLAAEQDRDRRVELHVRIEPFEQGCDVSAVERFKAALDRFHVLLRHPPQYLAPALIIRAAPRARVAASDEKRRPAVGKRGRQSTWRVANALGNTIGRMTGEELALAASAFFSGLAAGLLGMLSTIMRPMLAAMDGRDFREFMEAFLQFAAHSWGRVFNYAWAAGMTLGPAAALVLLADDPGSTSFILTAIALAIVIGGVLVVSNVWKTPTYNVILAWDPEALPADWKAGQQRYFLINWIQLATTWVVFALLLAALISL